MWRNFDGVNHSLRHSCWCYVLPALASVFGEMNKTAVATGINYSYFVWRFDHIINRVIIFSTSTFVGEGATTRILFGGIIACKVRTNHIPT